MLHWEVPTKCPWVAEVPPCSWGSKAHFLVLIVPRNSDGKRNCLSDDSTPRNPSEPEQLLFQAGMWYFQGDTWQDRSLVVRAQAEWNEFVDADCPRGCSVPCPVTEGMAFSSLHFCL